MSLPPPSSRSSSLPPLSRGGPGCSVYGGSAGGWRPGAAHAAGGDEESQAGGFVGINLKRSRVLLAGAGGAGDWPQRPPPGPGLRASASALRGAELFRGIAAPELGLGLGAGASGLWRTPGFRSPRSRSSRPAVGRDDEAMTATATERSRATAATPSAQGPPLPKPPRRRRSTRLRAVKTAYFSGEEAPSDVCSLAGGYPASSTSSMMERFRAVDDAIDAAGESESAAAREARLRREVAGLRTGEDAIKFFTRYGNNDTLEIKLLYCSRPPPGAPGAAAPASEGGEEAAQDGSPGPYDLWIVHPDKVGQEYWTISASGVVHFRPGELSDCTPLSEWMQQSLMYRVLTSMTFFRLYPHRKALEQWRDSARHAVYCRARQRLARRCFLANPVFLGSVVSARKAISQTNEVELLRLPPDQQCIQLRDFAELQASCLGGGVAAAAGLSHVHHGHGGAGEGAKEDLERVVDVLSTTLDHLVGKVHRFAQDVGLAAPGDGSAAALAASKLKRPSDKSKAMAEEKREAKERQHRQRIVKEDEAMVGGCVRLFEQLFQAHLVEALSGAAARLRRRVEAEVPGGEPPKKLFTVALGLEEGAKSIDSAPSLADFEATFTKLWKDMLWTVDSLPQLVSSKAMHRHGLDNRHRRSMAEVVATNRSWQESTSHSASAVLSALEEALSLAKKELSGPCARARAFSEAWDEASYMARAHSFKGLSKDMEGAQKVRDDLMRCRFQRVVGTVYLDGRSLRDSFTATSESALAAMNQALAALAHGRCLEASQRYDAVIKAVDDRPKEKHHFSLEAYTATYNWAVEEQTALDEVFQELKAMYEALVRNSYRVSLEDKVQLDGLAALERDLTHRAMLEARLFLDRRGDEMRRRSSAVSEVSASPAATPAASPAPGGRLTVTIETHFESGGELFMAPLASED